MTTPSISVSDLRTVMRDSYSTFCKLMQDDGWFDPIHEEICNEIQMILETTGNLAALRTGDDSYSTGVAKVMVVLPRGSLKSTIITKYLPIWLTLQSPDIRSLIASSTAPNADKKVDNIRGVYDSSELFRACFPELLPDQKCKWTSKVATIKRTGVFAEGTFESAGRKTQITGRHYHCIIEDDTVAPEKDDVGVDMAIPSAEDIESGIGFHKLATPLQLPKGPRIRVVVTTRWADFDLVEYIKKNESYHLFDYPALRDDGTPNFSIFYGKEELEEIKKSLGSYMFAALFLNRPIPAGDRLFREAWFHTYTPSTVPLSASYWVSIDPAISKDDDACDSALVGAFHDTSLLYVNDVVKGKFLPAELINQAMSLIAPHIKERTCGILVETVAFQKALVYFLKDELRRRQWSVKIVELNTRTKKEVRIAALQPLYENGQILHKKGLDPSLEAQLIQFPHGRLVDVPDSFAQHLAVYRGVYIKETPKVEEPTGSMWEAVKEMLGKRENVSFRSPYSVRNHRFGKLVGG